MAGPLTYEPAPSVDCPELGEALNEQSEGNSQITTRRLLAKRGAAALVLGVATVGAALLWLGRSPEETSDEAHFPVFAADGAIGLSAEDPCEDFPFLRLTGVSHSNLGGHGPDSGPEGLVFTAKDYLPGFDPADVIITVNASSSYKPGKASDNGINGKYGVITMIGGGEAEFTFTILDSNWQPKTLSKQEFTFFDLDQAKDQQNREYIKVSGTSQVWLTKNTEIQVSEEDGKKRYISSVRGTSSDNPADPLSLTVEQKNRAVTFSWKEFYEFKVTLGNTEGPHVRYFSFVARPSLLCANTVGTVEKGEDEVVAQGPAEEEKNCLFTIPVFNYCVPKPW